MLVRNWDMYLSQTCWRRYIQFMMMIMMMMIRMMMMVKWRGHLVSARLSQFPILPYLTIWQSHFYDFMIFYHIEDTWFPNSPFPILAISLLKMTGGVPSALTDSASPLDQPTLYCTRIMHKKSTRFDFSKHWAESARVIGLACVRKSIWGAVFLKIPFPSQCAITFVDKGRRKRIFLDLEF